MILYLHVSRIYAVVSRFLWSNVSLEVKTFLLSELCLFPFGYGRGYFMRRVLFFRRWHTLSCFTPKNEANAFPAIAVFLCNDCWKLSPDRVSWGGLYCWSALLNCSWMGNIYLKVWPDKEENRDTHASLCERSSPRYHESTESGLRISRDGGRHHHRCWGLEWPGGGSWDDGRRFHPNRGSGAMEPIRRNYNTILVLLPECTFKAPTEPEGWTPDLRNWNTRRMTRRSVLSTSGLYRMPRGGAALYAIWGEDRGTGHKNRIIQMVGNTHNRFNLLKFITHKIRQVHLS